MKPMRGRAVLVVTVAAGVLVGTVSATSYAATGNPNPMEVFVTNTADNPVPVVGAVNVNNLPTTQAVRGTVNVGNLPEVQTIGGIVAIEGMADGASLPVTMTEDHVSSRYQESRSYDGSAIGPAAEFEVPDGFLLLIQRATCSAQQDRGIRRARLVGPDSEFTGANGETHRTVDVPLSVDASGFSASAVTDFLTPGQQSGFPPSSEDPRYVTIAVDVVEGVGQASGVCTIIGRLVAK